MERSHHLLAKDNRPVHTKVGRESSSTVNGVQFFPGPTSVQKTDTDLRVFKGYLRTQWEFWSVRDVLAQWLHLSLETPDVTTDVGKNTRGLDGHPFSVDIPNTPVHGPQIPSVPKVGRSLQPGPGSPPEKRTSRGSTLVNTRGTRSLLWVQCTRGTSKYQSHQTINVITTINVVTTINVITTINVSALSDCQR